MDNNKIDLTLLDIDSIDLSRWNIDNEDAKKNKDLVSMLSMLDAAHCIVLSEDIGLVGYGYDEEPKMEVYVNGILENKIAVFNRTADIFGFRGNYFKVVNKYGELLFDEYIDAVYMIYNTDNKIIAYLFRLKDYIKANVNPIFDEKEAYVLYDAITEKLYVNALNNLEVAQKIGEITDSKFEFTCVGYNNYRFILDNTNYTVFKVCSNYDIYRFYEKL